MLKPDLMNITNDKMAPDPVFYWLNSILTFIWLMAKTLQTCFLATFGLVNWLKDKQLTLVGIIVPFLYMYSHLQDES